MYKYLSFIVFTSLIIEAYAANESATIFKPNTPAASGVIASNLKPQASQPQIMGGSNLTDADKDSLSQIKLNRKIELAKKMQELNKIQNGGTTSVPTNSTNTQPRDSQSQTVVTGVAIDVEGRKFATLQFIDGGVLDVTIGSKVGDYGVTNITLNGVDLSGIDKKTKGRKLHLKRVYAAEIKPRQMSSQQMNTNIFSPSPIVTSANQDENVVVPPIVTR